ncbi:MAG: GAF domain-containing protein [Chloroflexi bacterium]|nr:GAF domain-containing protein [Chloroflexota bacterium]
MAERIFPPHLDTQETYDLLLDTIRRVQHLIPFDSGGVMLYEPESQTLTPQVYLCEATNTPVPIPLGSGVIGRVAQRLEPELVNDMYDHPRTLFIDPASRAELAVPIAIDDTLLGVFNVESHHADTFTTAHLELLQALADQVAHTISAQRARDDLHAERQRLLEDRHARQRETEALQRLATITSATLNLNEMLSNALREAADFLGCEGAQLLVPDHVTYQLRVHESSVYGLARTWPLDAWPLDGPGYLVDVYHTGYPYISQTPPPDAGPHCRNVLACPLNTRSRTLGVLHLINQRSGRFNEAQIELAQTIANQVAVSMSSAQMFAAERRRADMMGQINRVSQEIYATLDVQVLLRKTAHGIHQVFGHEAVYILLLDPERQMVQVRACATSTPELNVTNELVFPVTDGVIGRTIRTNRTQIVPDVRNDPDYFTLEPNRRLQSCLTVPLREGEQAIGAIDILSTQINAFTDLERDALETLANQVSIALQNARHYDEAQRRLLEQSIVHQIGQDLTAILDYSELVQAMVQHMNRALNASGCLVGLYDPDRDVVHVEGDYRAPHHHETTETLSLGAELNLHNHHAMREAIATRRPVTVYRDDLDAPAAARALLENLGDSSQLILPMVAGDRVLGVVDWTDMSEGRVFTPSDIQLAQTLVAQATIAFDNALLFRELENRARQLAEANRLKSQFLATISHELRTPMNSIIGFSDTLLTGLYGELNEKQMSRLERIRRNGHGLLDLIDDLLDLSKIDAGRMELTFESVSIDSVVASVAQSMDAQAAERGLALHIAIPPDLPPLFADPQRTGQIVTNLLSNAIKFTHEGKITISATQTTRRGQPVVETTVADTGIGIRPEHQQIIFDEFRQADGSTTRTYGGTGLGLAICKRLVEMMDGAIWVESEFEVGSRFTFVLPVAQDPAPGETHE